MVVLEKQYPDLKMDELAACVIEYMNEEATIEDAEERDPVASEITTSPAAVDETTIPPLAGDDSSRTDPPVGPQYSQV